VAPTDNRNEPAVQGSRLWFDEPATAARGVRLVIADRPGQGRSDINEGCRSWAGPTLSSSFAPVSASCGDAWLAWRARVGRCSRVRRRAPAACSADRLAGEGHCGFMRRWDEIVATMIA